MCKGSSKIPARRSSFHFSDDFSSSTIRLEGTAVRDDDLLLGGTALGAELLNSIDDLLALNNLAEDDVGTVEP
jgi:hypothetical protein